MHTKYKLNRLKFLRRVTSQCLVSLKSKVPVSQQSPCFMCMWVILWGGSQNFQDGHSESPCPSCVTLGLGCLWKVWLSARGQAGWLNWLSFGDWAELKTCYLNFSNSQITACKANICKDYHFSHQIPLLLWKQQRKLYWLWDKITCKILTLSLEEMWFAFFSLFFLIFQSLSEKQSYNCVFTVF